MICLYIEDIHWHPHSRPWIKRCCCAANQRLVVDRLWAMLSVSLHVWDGWRIDWLCSGSSLPSPASLAKLASVHNLYLGLDSLHTGCSVYCSQCNIDHHRSPLNVWQWHEYERRVEWNYDGRLLSAVYFWWQIFTDFWLQWLNRMSFGYPLMCNRPHRRHSWPNVYLRRRIKSNILIFRQTEVKPANNLRINANLYAMGFS